MIPDESHIDHDKPRKFDDIFPCESILIPAKNGTTLFGGIYHVCHGQTWNCILLGMVITPFIGDLYIPFLFGIAILGRMTVKHTPSFSQGT
jgi:hypothetical protein